MSSPTVDLASEVKLVSSSQEMRESLAQAMLEVLQDHHIASRLGANWEIMVAVSELSTPKLTRSHLLHELEYRQKAVFSIRLLPRAVNAQSSLSTQESLG
jgi:hypothetical protein